MFLRWEIMLLLLSGAQNVFHSLPTNSPLAIPEFLHLDNSFQIKFFPSQLFKFSPQIFFGAQQSTCIAKSNEYKYVSLRYLIN